MVFGFNIVFCGSDHQNALERYRVESAQCAVACPAGVRAVVGAVGWCDDVVWQCHHAMSCHADVGSISPHSNATALLPCHADVG